jgi:acylaminoacyl-peptidase
VSAARGDLAAGSTTRLELRGVDTALVRIPDSSHALLDRPSRLIARVLHVLEWFMRHGGEPGVAKD